MLTRRPDWQAALWRFLDANSHRKFAYGQWDCCLFVCDAVLAITDIDLAAPFRGKYSTRAQAMRAVRDYAGSASVASIAGAVASHHFMIEVPALKARRGDVVLIKRPRDYSLGIVDIGGRIAVVMKQGLCRMPLSEAKRAWRV